MHRSTRALLLVWACLLAVGCGRSSSGGGAAPPQHGLDARPTNPTCLAPPLAAAPVEIELERVFANLALTQPLGMLQAPGDDSRWYVLQRTGEVRTFANDPDVAAFDTPDFIRLDVNASTLESGLHGMAFHPDFEHNGEVFIAWVEGEHPPRTVVARFRSHDGGLTLDPDSREDVLVVNQDGLFHNGGTIAFHPHDGYLYIGLGDGMYFNPGDQLDRAQDTTNLLGAMLRIDVDVEPRSETPYAIPPDNPFADNPACPADHTGTTDCPEIFAWGFRNPWKWSFDRASGTLWLGDVGQHGVEEVNIVELGGNYGWNCREGASPYANAPSACALATNLIDPVHDYPHTRQFAAVTGGYLYRGDAIASLRGQYVFGDFMNGELWRLYEDGEGGWTVEKLLDTELWISSFAQDIGGELYVMNYGGFPFPEAAGEIYRLVPRVSAGPPPEPVPVSDALSATGCVDPSNPSLPAAGLIPFAVVTPAWFDGAARERWLAIPDGTTMGLDAEDRFVLPERSVLMEHLRLDGVLIETRLLMHHPGGRWAGYSYEWNVARSEATLVHGGKTIDISGEPWTFPSDGQCLSCHRESAGYGIGTTSAQLNRDFHYEATARSANQLMTLAEIGLLATPLSDPAVLPLLPDAGDATLPLNDRARAYLHANCAHCHGSVAIAGLDLRYTTLLDHTGACAAVPDRGNLGIDDARIIAPGEPARSVLAARIDRRDAHGMPPLVTNRVDEDGVALIRAWIEELSGCIL